MQNEPGFCTLDSNFEQASKFEQRNSEYFVISYFEINVLNESHRNILFQTS